MSRILAFDSSAAHCAAAVVDGDRVVVARVEEMARGQAERLTPMLAEILAEAGLAWRDLDKIAVGVGPGNFTGVRIAVAAARGLALALRIPAIGLSRFQMALDPARALDPAPLLVSIGAPHDMAYVQPLSAGLALAPPQLIDPAAALPQTAPVTAVRGWRAKAIGATLGLPGQEEPAADFALRLGQCAIWRTAMAAPEDRPAPLYVRPADAAPPSDPPPRIIAG